jgi:hypothetical protein
MTPATLKFAGAALVAVAVAGFLTVADDWRHAGEFAAVAAVFVAGLAWFAAGRFPHWRAHVALAWLPVGLGIGLLAGAALDRMAFGAATGLVLGLWLARVRRVRTGRRAS